MESSKQSFCADFDPPDQNPVVEAALSAFHANVVSGNKMMTAPAGAFQTYIQSTGLNIFAKQNLFEMVEGTGFEP